MADANRIRGDSREGSKAMTYIKTTIRNGRENGFSWAYIVREAIRGSRAGFNTLTEI
jgi:hypothetical protein